jgi:hypothetical protein
VRVEGQTQDSGFGNVLQLETPTLTLKLETVSLTCSYSDIDNIFVRTQALREMYELELLHDRLTLVVWKVLQQSISSHPTEPPVTNSYTSWAQISFLLLYVRWQ